MDPFRHAAISLAFLAVTIKDMIYRALDNRRAGDLARRAPCERAPSSAQDSERASDERRPIDF